MGLALVTGGAGFIGSHISQELLRRGHRVRVLDDLSTGRAENLAGLDLEFIHGDIRDMDLVERVVAEVDLVFHHAAMVSVPASIPDPQTCYAINLQGSLNVLLAAHRAGAKRVVLASSAAVYGEADGEVNESMDLQPVSPYASSKIAMEQVAQLFTRVYGLPTVSLRYFNVYGPRQSPDSHYAAAIPIFISALLRKEAPTIFGDGLQTRDFIFIRDVVQANLLASESEAAAGHILNISGGGAVSILDLVSTLKEIIPSSDEPKFGPEREGDIRFSSADLRRAEELLAFHPSTSLKDGLQETVAWFEGTRV